MTVTSIQSLPDDALGIILQMTHFPTSRQVCKKWNQLLDLTKSIKDLKITETLTTMLLKQRSGADNILFLSSGKEFTQLKEFRADVIAHCNAGEYKKAFEIAEKILPCCRGIKSGCVEDIINNIYSKAQKQKDDTTCERLNKIRALLKQSLEG